MNPLAFGARMPEALVGPAHAFHIALRRMEQDSAVKAHPDALPQSLRSLDLAASAWLAAREERR